MAIREFDGKIPQIADSAFVDETAVVIGEVTLGEEASIWPTAVLRGDIHSIKVGARSNVQDGSVVHVTHASGYNPHGHPTTIGEDVTVGHRVVLHGCTIGNRCLIGMGAIVLDGAVVEDEVIIGAGALVTQGKRLEAGHLYVGSPARQARPITDEEREFLRYSAQHYARLGTKHRG
ncbi:gamma carbonic anhydrase family protein [Endothiovibrio diazotrophicus]